MEKEKQHMVTLGIMSRKDVYKSKLWKTTRVEYARYKNCLCERCKKPIYMTGINDYLPKEKRRIGIVHHKIHLTDENYMDSNIAYSWENLELLCIYCHNEEHAKGNAIRQEYYFDENGNLKQQGV